MKTFLVKANQHQPQIITCNITDQLVKNIPISVMFFYPKSIDDQILINSLEKILDDFPIFAGRLQKDQQGNLLINCQNQGVAFSIQEISYNMIEILNNSHLIKQQKIINYINNQKVIINQSSLLTIQVNYCNDGSMILGISWHHSIGDMCSFMSLMKAWSKATNQQQYDLPLIVKNRDKYLEQNLPKQNKSSPKVIYLTLKNIVNLLFYFLINAKNKMLFQIYFSDDELKNMKQDFIVKTGQNLSTNDVLCAYILTIIAQLDQKKQFKNLSFAINYRSKINLPPNIIGNFVDFLSLPLSKDDNYYQIAQNIRNYLNNYSTSLGDFQVTKKYVENYGGLSKINRFFAKTLYPLQQRFMITNWSKFGVYDINFLGIKPIFFTPFGEPPLSFISVIVEGFSNQGLLYSLVLPKKLGQKLHSKNVLKILHQYRSEKDNLPDLVTQLSWLL